MTAMRSSPESGLIPDSLHELIDDLYRRESRQVLATLIRLLGSFDLAEEALHEAFKAALEQWAHTGLPAQPRAWLVSTGRFKAIDGIRRRARFDSVEDMAEQVAAISVDLTIVDDDHLEDDRLRLIFTCCHPALSVEAQIALTLREVCGLSTDAIAQAFLISSATLAQRIVRAKTKIRTAGIPYQVPSPEALPDRLDTVRQVIYLVFNEGYSASTGASLTRPELSNEAIRLTRLLNELMPQVETKGLLALMLLHESRRTARSDGSGKIIVLTDQDRSLWNRSLISEGIALLEQALTSPHVGKYSLQAAISAVHAEAIDAQSTDWAQIVGLYDLLLRVEPSPIVELNRAVAVSMHLGAEMGLTLINTLLARGELTDYRLAHAAQADMYRRLGQSIQAEAAYQRALALSLQDAERRFLQQRLIELKK